LNAEDSAEYEEVLSEMQVGCRRIADIVHSLQIFSGPSTETGGKCFLQEALERAIAFELGDAMGRVEVRLPSNPAEHNPTLAIGSFHLDQVFRALFKNARQATGDSQKIRIDIGVESQEVKILVEDEGIGMDPATLQRIFEPFFTTRGTGGGMGLGLTVAWGIVQRVGGELDVRSKLGQGSKFTLTIPRTDSKESVPSSASANAPPP
jgi:signal transduction histidine kinase